MINRRFYLNIRLSLSLFSLLVIFGGCEQDVPPAEDVAASQTTAQPPAAPSLEPAEIDAALTAARDYLESNRLDEAAVILGELTEQAPDAPEGHKLYGEVMLSQSVQMQKQGDSEAAASLREHAYEQFVAAADLESGNAPLQHATGVLADQIGLLDDALTYYKNARKIDASNPQYWLYEAQVHLRQQNYEKAMLATGWVLRLDPDSAWGYASMAEINLARNRLNIALEHIRQAREISSKETAFRVTEAKILRRQNKPGETLALLTPLPKLQRAGEAVAKEIATAYAMQGEHEQAAAAWAVCFELNPSSSLAAIRAAEAHLRSNDRVAAMSWFEQAKQVAPDSEAVQSFETALAEEK